MPVETLHPDYVSAAEKWERARDVIAGEDAVKARGERYLPKLDNQTSDDYETYKARACFYNATARTLESLVGLVFRQPVLVKLPAAPEGLARGVAAFARDADLQGSELVKLARRTVEEVLAVGRCGVLVDWGGASGTGDDQAGAQRAVAAFYEAEDIWNWRVEVVRGRRELTLLVLREKIESRKQKAEIEDEFETEVVEQLRVYRVVEGAVWCEVWQFREVEGHSVRADGKSGEREWVRVETKIPARLGKALRAIPFVFAGVGETAAAVGPVPLEKLMTINLDHYRLDADFKHGLHYTALPTAYVVGVPDKSSLVVGSRTAWVLEDKDARAGYLEFTGQGLTTFERAQDRDERMMAVMGTRMLEPQKRAYESAQAIEVRQTAENSALGVLAQAVSDAMTAVLRWVCWWHSAAERPEDCGPEWVRFELGQDFSPVTMGGDAVRALVDAWEKGAITREALAEALRRGEVVRGEDPDSEDRNPKGEDNHG